MEETICRRASVTVDLSGNLCSAVDLTGRVHQLPCCIKYNGSSEVSNYFRPKPTEVVFDGLSERKLISEEGSSRAPRFRFRKAILDLSWERKNLMEKEVCLRKAQTVGR
ncbi:unnamed protein product [Cuscuta epithymum]|uniref:Uncharacterized protein n=1 Tax=Cuscuta epithymum TaxID=186058 RepID=A0AAV0FWD9_9ASTE|nr:unnamed protein product [Cuscuta epithymum]